MGNESNSFLQENSLIILSNKIHPHTPSISTAPPISSKISLTIKIHPFPNPDIPIRHNTPSCCTTSIPSLQSATTSPALGKEACTYIPIIGTEWYGHQSFLNTCLRVVVGLGRSSGNRHCRHEVAHAKCGDGREDEGQPHDFSF